MTTGGRLTLQTGAGSEGVWVTVADTGPGVPGSAREAIFEKYRQIVTGEAGARETLYVATGLFERAAWLIRRLSADIGDLAGEAEASGAAAACSSPAD